MWGSWHTLEKSENRASDVSKEMWDAENFNKYSSNFTENFKGIVLKGTGTRDLIWLKVVSLDRS